MRRPQEQLKAAPRQQVSTVQSVSAPTGGWNAKNPLAAMPPHDAVKLLNFFPTTVDVVTRGGAEAYGTGITGMTETLAVYNKTDGTSEMYAASETDVYDVSSSGAASAQSLTVTNGRFQWLNSSDGTNQWLIMVNGVDTPKYYNGTSWVEVTGASSPALTGLTTTKIVNVTEYHNRLYFLEKDSLSFWYLAAGAVGGALTEFDLAAFCDKGGYLMWAATWTFDGGDGLDDYIVFMTSQGEAVIYSGTDPSTASDWVRKGTYAFGKPLGRRSHVKYGGDLIVLTQNGAFPLADALRKIDIDDRVAVTDKIESAFNTAALGYWSNFGWEATIYPLRSALIVNIPFSETTGQQQYVMNTITGAWCEFDSWDAQCFVVYNDELYFGAETVVQKAWTGISDFGSDVVCEGKTAFNYFGQNSQSKRLTMFRPLLQVNGSLSFLTDVDVDFSDNPITGLATFTPPSTALWDSAVWDTAQWVASLSIVRRWTSPDTNVGYAFSGKLKVNTSSVVVHWIANDYLFEYGGVIG